MTSPELSSRPPRTNTFALIGFIGVFFMPILGIIFGVLAQRQIAVTNEAGRGFARWALGLGIAGTAFYVLFFIVWFAMFFRMLLNIPIAP